MYFRHPQGPTGQPPAAYGVDVAEPLRRALEERIDTTAHMRRAAEQDLDRLKKRRSKLLQAYLNEAVTLEDLKAEQAAIQAAIRSAELQLHADETHLRAARLRLSAALDDLSRRSATSTASPASIASSRRSTSLRAESQPSNSDSPTPPCWPGSSNDGLVEVTGRYSNRQIAQLAAQLLDVTLSQL
jgi:hypothetical protein